ncbi:MAG: terminase [Acidobacteriaceae bacterium]
MFEEKRGRQNIVLKARQMGMTTWVAARFFLRTITRPGTMTLQVAHTREAAESIFRIVQRMWEQLPGNLCEQPLVRSRANAGQMVFPRIDSEFRVASACDVGVGRGLSLQNLHCSEVASWPGDAKSTLAGLRAALAPDGELVLESTPNGAYGAFYEEWCSGTDEKNETDALVRHFMPWWMEPSYVRRGVEVLTDVERSLVERYGLSAEQIGYRRGLEKNYGGMRSQEFAEDAETCFRATGACFFDVDAIERRMDEVDPPLTTRRAGRVMIWYPPAAEREYIVAVDSAGGGQEGDFAAVQVIDRMTGLQCAELQERLRPAELAKVAVELAKEYSEALIAVERNNHGAAVLAYIETSERYCRVYRQGVEAGWLTTAASKPEMTARVGSLLEQSPELFQSRRLLDECRTFVGRERGKTGAANGAHDDLVMAMAVGQAVRSELPAGRSRARLPSTIR